MRCGERLQGGSETRECPRCGYTLRRMGRIERLVDRWLRPDPSIQASELQAKHYKLIELMWSADGAGQALYESLELGRVPYSRFVREVTDLVCRGIDEGWLDAVMPQSPTSPGASYYIDYRDAEKFRGELLRLFPPASPDDS